MTQSRQKTEQLTHAATSSVQYGAIPEDLANFPGMMNLVAGSGVSFTPGSGTLTITATGGGGTVTSVDVSGGTTGLTFSGGPVTTSGTMTMAGTLAIANGGTGATNAAAARANLGAGTGNGTVTSVSVSGNNGIGVSGSPVTTSGTVTLSLGAITPTSVSTGALTASGAISLPAGSITKTNLANGAAGSVLGHASLTGSGAIADISSASQGDVLYNNGLSLQFGKIDGFSSINDGSITAVKLYDGAACSVIGRSANSTGVHADISMGTNDRVLGRVSNVVQSTQLTAGMFPNNVVSNAILRQGAAKSVIGVTGNATANVADIASTGARTFLASNSGNTAVAFRAMDSGDLPGGNWIGSSSGIAYASGITSLLADTTWYDTGASIILSAGTYLITSIAHCALITSSGTGTVVSKLYNVTDAVDVTDSECTVFSTSLTGTYQATGTFSTILTLSGTKTIRMDAQRVAGGTYTSVSIRSNTAGRSAITYVRIY